MKLAALLFIGSLQVIFAQTVFGKDVPVQGRLFVGITSADPKDVNLELEAQSLKKVDSVQQYGVEITYPVLKYFEVGIRYTRRTILRDEMTPSLLTDYSAQINQDSALLVGRVPFLKSTFVRMDAFAGIGGSNTSLKIKTASQDGELSRKESKDWFGAPCASYGASVGFGYKQFYFVVEGGMEMNKITNLKRTGNVNNNIETIDLSASYFTIGLLFDGVPGTIK